MLAELKLSQSLNRREKNITKNSNQQDTGI